jgi:hypothetical protein
MKKVRRKRIPLPKRTKMRAVGPHLEYHSVEQTSERNDLHMQV